MVWRNVKFKWSALVALTIVAAGLFSGFSVEPVKPLDLTITETQITTNIADQIEPAIYGNVIVWEDYRTGNSAVYMCNLSTGTETQITTPTMWKKSPKIYGNNIVWMNNGDIYMYDLSTGTETRITGDNAVQTDPAIYGSIIVWVDSRTDWGDIYMYDLLTGTQTPICTNTANQIEPAIYGNVIVWEDNRNGIENWDIYMYDLLTGTEAPVTTAPTHQTSPAIYGDIIVWQDRRNGNYDIYMYDLSTGTESQVTTNTEGQYRPAIYGNIVVWEDYRTENGDIYMYDLSTGIETKVTTNSVYPGDPDIYGNGIVWEDWRNGNYDIYLANFSFITVNFSVQTIEVLGTGVQAYVYIENNGSTPEPVYVDVLLGVNVIRHLTNIYVPAAIGAVSGKYFIDKTTIGASSGTITVNVYSATGGGLLASASGSFSLDIDCPHPGGGDATDTGDAYNDVNVYDAILESYYWGGVPGPSTTATIRGPWAQANGDFNDDNTIDIFDACMLSINYGANWLPTPP